MEVKGRARWGHHKKTITAHDGAEKSAQMGNTKNVLNQEIFNAAKLGIPTFA